MFRLLPVGRRQIKGAGRRSNVIGFGEPEAFGIFDLLAAVIHARAHDASGVDVKRTVRRIARHDCRGMKKSFDQLGGFAYLAGHVQENRLDVAQRNFDQGFKKFRSQELINC